MSFYNEWLNCQNTKKEEEFISDFLNKVSCSNTPFYSGNSAEVDAAISVICSVPIEEYIRLIDRMDLSAEVVSADIPQYSNFSAAVVRLPEILEFYPKGLGFEEIGYQLKKSPTEGAGTKYGENHAKLAAMMDLVSISERPSKVEITSLGHFLVTVSLQEKKDLLVRLLLREHIVKKLICSSKYNCSYREIVRGLADSTAERRRSNVKSILEYVLSDTSECERLDRIDWKVKRK